MNQNRYDSLDVTYPNAGRSRVRRFYRSAACSFLAALVLVSLGPPSAARRGSDDETGGCARYQVLGLAPGMDSRDVRRIMGRRGDRISRNRGPNGVFSSATFLSTPIELEVDYDREVTIRSDAEVVRLVQKFDERTNDPNEVLGSLVDRFGAPNVGDDTLANGLRSDPVRWIDEACDVVVSAYRKPAEWWQPSHGDSIHVEIQPLSDLRYARVQDPLDGRPDAEAIPASRSYASEPRSIDRNRPVDFNADQDRHAETDPDPMNTEPTSPPGVSAGEVLFAGVGGVTAPTRLQRFYVQPTLPTLARRLQATGRVLLEATVRADGTVDDLSVLSASRTKLGLEQAAIEAVQQWRYMPATLDGSPVDARITVQVDFR